MANGIGDALINIGAGLMDRNTREREAKRLRDAQLEERKYQEDMAFKMNEANNAARAALEDKRAANKRLEMLNKQTVTALGNGSFIVQGYGQNESDPNKLDPYIDTSNIKSPEPKQVRGIPTQTADGRIVILDPSARGDTGLRAPVKSGARTDADMLALDEAKLRQRKLLDAQLRLEAVDSMSAGEVAKAIGTDPRWVKPAQVEEFKKSTKEALKSQIKFLSSDKQGSSKSSGSWLGNAFGGLLGTAAAPVDELAKRAAVGEPVDMPPGTRMDIIPIGEENFNKMVDDILKEAKSSGTPISRTSAEQMAREELGLK